MLDPTRYYLILPDNIGRGQCSRPNDGLSGRFPHYGYDDKSLHPGAMEIARIASTDSSNAMESEELVLTPDPPEL